VRGVIGNLNQLQKMGNIRKGVVSHRTECIGGRRQKEHVYVHKESDTGRLEKLPARKIKIIKDLWTSLPSGAGDQKKVIFRNFPLAF
jgi:hypothetical protein